MGGRFQSRLGRIQHFGWSLLERRWSNVKIRGPQSPGLAESSDVRLASLSCRPIENHIGGLNLRDYGVGRFRLRHYFNYRFARGGAS